MWHPRYCDDGIELSASKVTAKQRQPHMSTLLAVPRASRLPLASADPLLAASPSPYKRCFEIVIEANRGAVFVGWVEANIVGKSPLHLALGIGCYPGTFAIDSYAGSVGSNGKWRSFADRKFRNGDVVTSELDLSVGTISYWLNGSPLGVAFRGLDCSMSYHAAVSLKFNRTKVTAHFDAHSFKFPLPDLGTALADWSAPEKLRHFALAAQNAAQNDANAFYLLPKEILLEVFSYLSAGQLTRCLRVCLRFAEVGTDDLLWASILRREFEFELGDLESDLMWGNKGFGSLGFEPTGENKGALSSPGSLTKPSSTLARPSESRLIRKYQLKLNWRQGHATKTGRFFLHNREAPSALQFDSSLLVVAAGKHLEFLDVASRSRIDSQPSIKPSPKSLKTGSDAALSLNYSAPNGSGMKVMDYDILALCFDDTNLVTAGSRGFFTLLDLDTSQVLWSIQAHKSRDVEAVHFRKNQRTFATGGWDGSIQGWDIEEARNLFKISKAHSKGQEGGYVATLKWTPPQISEQCILSGGYDGRLRLFDVRAPASAVAEVRHAGAIVNDLAFSPLGHSVAVSCYNSGVMLYDLRKFCDGKDAFLMQVREQPKTRCVHFDGQLLVSAGFSHNIVGWDTTDNRPSFSLNSRQVLCLGVDEKQLIVGDDAGRLTFYDFSEPPSWSPNALSYFENR